MILTTVIQVKLVCAILFMAAVASLRCNLRLKGFYDRLIANHKPPKVALVAVMRKLLNFMNAVLNNKIILFGLMIMFNAFSIDFYHGCSYNNFYFLY